MEDNDLEAKDVSLGTLVSVPPVSKSSNFVVSQALSCVTLQMTSSLNSETVYVHITSNMYAVLVFP